MTSIKQSCFQTVHNFVGGGENTNKYWQQNDIHNVHNDETVETFFAKGKY